MNLDKTNAPEIDSPLNKHKPEWFGNVSLSNPALQTPMMKQFIQIKSQVPDALLLFRMGDFYELFLNDAVVAGRLLDLNVTSRNKKDPEPVPMAGIPHHAIEGYLPRMTQAGFKVAIAEQRGDPSLGKMLERQLTRVVTPGVPWDSDGLESKESYWLVGVTSKKPSKGPYGIAALDVSTGEFIVSEFSTIFEISAEILRLNTKELVLPASLEHEEALSDIRQKIPYNVQNRGWFDQEDGYQILCKQFQVSNLNGFGVRSGDILIGAAAAVITYVREVTYTDLRHVNGIQRYSVSSQMKLDEATKTNLEIFNPQRGTNKKHTLLYLLDQTKTAMGGRLLRKWLGAPLLDLTAIQRRHDSIEVLLDDNLRDDIQTLLHTVYDLERLSGKLAQLTIHPKALRSLAESILVIPDIFNLLTGIDSFKSFIPTDIPESLGQEILESLSIDPPITINEGGIFSEGYNQDLDELRRLTSEVKALISQMEDSLRIETDITSLKVKHNRVFGYFIEVTSANKNKVPEEWIRKQTLTNVERFITPELKEFEEKILTSGERAKSLEQQLYIDLRKKVSHTVTTLQQLANKVANVDVLCSLSEIAVANRYCRPTMDLSLNIALTGSRHPIIEQLPMLEAFVPNDIHLDATKRQILLTGPNMSGKSTIMRQVALTVFLAQIGSFVPARTAHIGLTDSIFVRVGASDDLAEGRSTFMVEMSETAFILNQATEQSLILLDEIGRGTSTFDGMSIAWAVAEAIHNQVRSRCIFATHYHELTKLSDECGNFRNMHVAIKEDRGEVRFLRLLQEGAIGKSYGIQCARLAGLPRSVIRRASEILSGLEDQATEEDDFQIPLFSDKGTSILEMEANTMPPNIKKVIERIENLSLDDHSPLEALQELYNLQSRLLSE